MNKQIVTTVVVLGLSSLAFAGGPYSVPVATDVYGVAQGGTVNGIPTAHELNDGVPDIFDAINLIQGSSLTHNYMADPLYVPVDEVWKDIEGTVALIGLTAGHSNTLGVYTDLGIGAVQTPILGPYSGFGFVGDGTMASPLPAALTGLSVDTSFGWYLDSSGIDYFSQPALNPAGLDHMMTFDLPGADGTTIYVDYGIGATPITLNDPSLIAWEDLPWDGTTLGDDDYDDMMYIVDKVSTPRVPVPGAILLASMGAGLVGWMRRRRAL